MPITTSALTDLKNRLRSGAPSDETWIQLANRTNRERSEAADCIAELEAQLAADVPRQGPDENIPRVIAFIEQLDKKLDSSGYTHAQRMEIVGMLMSNKVAAMPKAAQEATNDSNVVRKPFRWISQQDAAWLERNEKVGATSIVLLNKGGAKRVPLFLDRPQAETQGSGK